MPLLFGLVVWLLHRDNPPKATSNMVARYGAPEGQVAPDPKSNTRVLVNTIYKKDVRDLLYEIRSGLTYRQRKYLDSPRLYRVVFSDVEAGGDNVKDELRKLNDIFESALEGIGGAKQILGVS